MDDTNDTNENFFNKSKYFKEKNICIHISKKNGWFHNGFICDIQSDFLILIDEKDGEIPIFFNEINEIEKREEK